MVFNTIAIILSTAAFATSTYIALQHQALQRAANFAPAYLHLLKHFQSMEFHDDYRYVTTRLRAEHDPEVGLSGLPDDARRVVYNIAYFFHGYGMFRMLRILDDQVLPTMQPRMVAVWNAIGPFVEREREIQGLSGTQLLRALEVFAKRAEALPPDEHSAVITRREFDKIQRELRRSVQQP